MDGIPYLEMDELCALFGYKNIRALRSAIRAGRFPVKLFELAGRRVASVEVVKAYFERMAEETMADSPAPEV